jgi:putative acetyltransferase
MQIIVAQSVSDFDLGRQLFREYADTLGFDLGFQGFLTELDTLQVQYAAPEGALFLVKKEGDALGCAGIRRWRDDVAELKRMYLRPAARGLGAGQQLLDATFVVARELGFRAIRLDTLSDMTAALHLYRRNGFEDIEPYRPNPFADAVFLEKKLDE